MGYYILRRKDGIIWIIKILVADDEKEIRDLLEIYLINEGYKVIKAQDGQEALDIIDKEEIDLLVLDINLPGVDGFYILEKLRESDINTRVIIVSANREIEDRIKGLDLGANDYLVKPILIFWS